MMTMSFILVIRHVTAHILVSASGFSSYGIIVSVIFINLINSLQVVVIWVLISSKVNFFTNILRFFWYLDAPA